MAFDTQITVKNLDKTQKYLEGVTGSWRVITRASFKAWGDEFTDLAAALSPTDELRDVDPRRRFETFVHSWEFKVHGRDPELDIGNVDEAMPFIVFPTDPEPAITSKGDYPLKFYLDDGTVMYAWSIDKPATPGQPVHLWALQEFDADRHIAQLKRDIVRRS